MVEADAEVEERGRVAFDRKRAFVRRFGRGEIPASRWVVPSSRKRCDSSSAGSREEEVGVVEVAYVRDALCWGKANR